ncbi:hypothetical protein [Sphingobacterium detergens]|uniref:hypothetical protein n=1 Tax=Sphingobacterium detergens TaxID=1145106 RepID=UPI0011C35DA0|nr:hypothetical protein [Sphingobacterium detergens]
MIVARQVPCRRSAVGIATKVPVFIAAPCGYNGAGADRYKMTCSGHNQEETATIDLNSGSHG